MLRRICSILVKPFEPRVFMWFNGFMSIFWTVMIPLSIYKGWINSIPFISAISIYALITGHASTWQSARVEMRQREQEKASDGAQT